MISEKIIVGENTKYPLNGLLTLPENITKPVPAVVFVHGSGILMECKFLFKRSDGTQDFAFLTSILPLL